MEVANIKGTRDYIKVFLADGRSVKIFGEMVVGGFVAEKASIRRWMEPEGEPISPEDKQEIINAVIDKTKDISYMVITFE